MIRNFSFSALLLVLAGSLHAEPVSFRNEVMAVFSRAGCNMGACHGNQNGKNGFKLSLRGEDPSFDIQSLKRDMLGRRINPQRPEASLILLKATGSITHEGGRRFGTGSREYRILHDWIRQGAKADTPSARRLVSLEVTPAKQILIEPADQVRLKVRAGFDDGSTEDVTGLAVFEPSNDVVSVDGDGLARKQDHGETTVMVRYLDRQATAQLAFVPARPDFQWPNVPPNNYIDQHIFAKLRSLRIAPSEVCGDEVFLRRVYLDTLGILPTAEEARRFLDDHNENKRDQLIEELLKREEFNDYWALKWSDLLRNEEKVLDRTGVRVFHQWLRKSIKESKPLNEMARELLSATGSTYENPPANYYRALRDPQIRAEATAQVFLGIRIQCARCHNHPFEQWTQDDYHSTAAFFARVKYKIKENKRKDKFDKHEFVGEQIVERAESGEVKNPRNGEETLPRFLLQKKRVKTDNRLKSMADWVADPENPFFAKAQVNRIWYHYFGRGLVEPNDDFRASNPPVNEPLLDALAEDFVKHDFDLRHMVRVILRSKTYQLSAVPNATNAEDARNFSHASRQTLEAEQLLDACAHVTGVPVPFTGYDLGIRAGEIPGVRAKRPRDAKPTEGDKFLRQFGKPPRSLNCDCERSKDTTLGQAFQLITGRLINSMLTNKDNRLGKLIHDSTSPDNILEDLYLSALQRYPTESERGRILELVESSEDARKTWEDILWSLMCSKEFLLRR